MNLADNECPFHAGRWRIEKYCGSETAPHQGPFAFPSQKGSARVKPSSAASTSPGSVSSS
jgi:hypothetical protein